MKTVTYICVEPEMCYPVKTKELNLLFLPFILMDKVVTLGNTEKKDIELYLQKG